MNCLENIKLLVDIIQGIVIIAVTVFTARWTFKTFAHKEKLQELKELKQLIDLYHYKLQIFCAQLRESEVNQKEIEEKLELVMLHNKLLAFSNQNLYTKKDFRKNIQQIVGSWLTNERLKLVQRRENVKLDENKIKETWQKFEDEYKKVMDLIDEEAGKIL